MNRQSTETFIRINIILY